jgi:5'-nucleotidase (lipoprotein e(P4) family)
MNHEPVDEALRTQNPEDNTLVIKLLNEENKSPRSWMEHMEPAARTLSLVAIPLVLAVAGYVVQLRLAERNTSAAYLDKAIAVLSSDKANSTLKPWAVKILEKYSPIPFEDSVVEGFKRGDVLLPLALPGEASRKPSPEIQWTRNSAEHRAVFLQNYALATRIVRERSMGLAPNTWAVILDADETVIDNSQFQKEQAASGRNYTPTAWSEWCLRGEAKPLPGVIPFLQEVHRLGGRIAIVTNREAQLLKATEENFRMESIPFDQILCRTSSSAKDARLESIENGKTPLGWPPMKVILWVGDNVQDFPNMTQKQMLTGADEAYSKFGSEYLILPNPMYGSWERNPVD